MPKRELLDFFQALKQALKGKKIHKLEWKNKDEYGLIKGGLLKLHTKGVTYDWIVSDGDMKGKDYIIL